MIDSAHHGGAAGRCMVCPAPHDGLHVWQVDLDDPHARADDCAQVLDPGERARADQFAFALLRQRYLAAHVALRGILGLSLGRAPDAIALRTDANGKPCLADAPRPLRFNLSHSAGMALVAVSWRHEVGVDLERWSEPAHLMAMVGRYFSVSEKEAFWTMPDDQRMHGFHRWWTLKEACLKATGVGLRYPLDAFSVEFRPQFRPRLLDGPSTMQGLQLWSLDMPGVGWSAALAWAQPQANGVRPLPTVRQWSWQGWRI